MLHEISIIFVKRAWSSLSRGAACRKRVIFDLFPPESKWLKSQCAAEYCLCGMNGFHCEKTGDHYG